MKSILTLLCLFSLELGLMAQNQATATKLAKEGRQGFIVEESTPAYTQVSFYTGQLSFEEITLDGIKWMNPCVEGIFLPSESGHPNLPGSGRFVGIPNGSRPRLEIMAIKSKSMPGIRVAPAPRIPKETEDGLEYKLNEAIYGKDAVYPAEPIRLSEPTMVRGIEMVMLGITPFTYNPVSKELTIIEEVTVRIYHQDVPPVYGESRLRSRWFDPLLEDMLLNPGVLPERPVHQARLNTEDDGCEYLIIVPNDAVFMQWADSIKRFRTEQGILTAIKTLAQVGGNTPALLEAYINNAYNTWAIPPVAILLLGDYGSNAANTITSPIWDSYCASDNILGDVSNNNLPDIIMARITAQNESQLQVMIRKFIDYERNPPVSPSFYAHPISALGWQTERWFQICSEVVGGYWANSLGKSPVRINAVYGGNPAVDPWSTATNTTTVVNYFGPSGLGYIPASPQSLGGWTGGTAAQVNAALNAGSFMLQHRDHGYEQGWGEPSYSSSSINSLTNTDLSFIMSINCLTGKYNYGSEVFAEKFHRYTYGGVPAGALGIIAASEVSYSFVNDAYSWGLYDNLWPSFMPGYGTNPSSRGILPAFGNAAGKYFLQQSSWPYNTGSKTVTHHLFHHHGDAFLTVFSEVPQMLSVAHDPVILTGMTTFSVTANTGAFICLSLDNEILGTATGTGSPVSITIPGNQLPPNQIKVVVTLQNYYRYTGYVQVIPPSGPFVVKELVTLSDPAGNNNGQLDFGEQVNLTVAMKNVGVMPASNVQVTLTSNDPYTTITNPVAYYGTISAGAITSVTDAFSLSVSASVPDMHLVSFTLTATNGTDTWTSHFSLQANAPVLQYLQFTISDPAGNGNNKADPGESFLLQASIKNKGNAMVQNVIGVLSTGSPFLNILSNNLNFGNIAPGATVSQTFTLSAALLTPMGQQVSLSLNLSGDYGITGNGSIEFVIGQIPVLVINLDGNGNGGTAIQAAVQANNVACDLVSSFPASLTAYSSVFVCLGIYSNNHVLTSQEGQALADYLNSGGKVYMEGGDTWAYDASTAVHPLFGIDGQSDGSADLTTVLGQASTFTQGMSFAYSGENNWIDRLVPLTGTGAFTILSNQSPAYATAIANATGAYKTIGASHEFAGLVNATSPSTKNELMFQYLQFFNLINLNVAANFIADDTLLLAGQSATFTDLSTGNPTAWDWSFPGGTPASSTQQNPVITYSLPGIYDITLSVTNGYNVSTLTKTAYILVGSETLSGYVRYDNSASTPLTNTLVKLTSGPSVIAQGLSDATGAYLLEEIPPGYYTLGATCSKPWGGVNATDALLIMKHFVGITPLTGIRLKAGDVDGSTVVNAVDALAAQRRSVGIINSFPAGDWAFERPVLHFTGINQPPQNFKGLCTGDVNGSFIPATRQAAGIQLLPKAEISVSPGQEFQLPVYSLQDIAAAAISLHFEVLLQQFDLLDVIAVNDPAQLVWKLDGNRLAVSWYSLQASEIPSGQILLYLKMKVKAVGHTPEPLRILEGEIADSEGIPYNGICLGVPSVGPGPLQFSAYLAPNPISETSLLHLCLPEESMVKACLYDISGRKVAEIYHDYLPASWNTISLEKLQATLQEKGVYYINIQTNHHNLCLPLLVVK